MCEREIGAEAEERGCVVLCGVVWCGEERVRRAYIGHDVEVQVRDVALRGGHRGPLEHHGASSSPGAAARGSRSSSSSAGADLVVVVGRGAACPLDRVHQPLHKALDLHK